MVLEQKASDTNEKTMLWSDGVEYKEIPVCCSGRLPQHHLEGNAVTEMSHLCNINEHENLDFLEQAFSTKFTEKDHPMISKVLPF